MSPELATKETRQQANDWLCHWFISRRKFKGDASQLPPVNYFDAALLTSLEVIEFVSEIEDRFAVQFSEQDFQDPRFVTVAGLADLIAELSAHPREHGE